MNTVEKLQSSLKSILAGSPWYGPATFDILANVTFDAAYEKPPGSVHNIAGIVLHMIGWTQEVIARMGGKIADEPAGGDWPDPGQPDEHKWQILISDFKLVNVALEGVVQNFPHERWEEKTNDERNSELSKGVNYRELIEGLIQHHIYHSGQIALLNRIVSGGAAS